MLHPVGQRLQRLGVLQRPVQGVEGLVMISPLPLHSGEVEVQGDHLVVVSAQVAVLADEVKESDGPVQLLDGRVAFVVRQLAHQRVYHLPREKPGQLQQQLPDISGPLLSVCRRGQQDLPAVFQLRHTLGPGHGLVRLPQIPIEQNEDGSGLHGDGVVSGLAGQALAQLHRFRPAGIFPVPVVITLKISLLIVAQPLLVPPPARLCQRLGQRQPQPLVLGKLRQSSAQNVQTRVYPLIVSPAFDLVRLHGLEHCVNLPVPVALIAE